MHFNKLNAAFATSVLWIAFSVTAFGQAVGDPTHVSVRNLSSSAQSGVPVTFGQVFGPGEVTNANALGLTIAGGSALATQVDVKATHNDGSLRHAIVSAVLPSLGAQQAAQLQFDRSASQASGPDVGLSDVLATSFDASVSLTTGGTAYSASARQLLQSSTPEQWLSGAVASEWLVSGPLRTAGGAEHPHLTARFSIRAYDGLQNIRVSVTVENNWSRVSNPRNFNYDVTVSLQGEGTVLSQSNVTHYRQARWRRVFWWGAEPNVHVEHDSDYLQRIGVVPTYDSRLSIPEYVLQEMNSDWSGARTRLMGSGLIYSYMPDGGGRPDIAPLPRWTARYLMTQDVRAKVSMMGTAEQAGSFGIHYRDRDTGLPISLDTYPSMTILGNGGIFPSCSGSCGTPYTPDVAHQPSMSFVPYLISGDYYHLEELQFWANWNMFYWGNHGGSQGLMVNDQVRAQAWGLRTLGHAAYITPDAHPLKAYFTAKLGNNLDWYQRNVVDSPPTPLGYLLNPSDLGLDNTFATWMDDFFTWTVGHLANLGFSAARPVFDYKAQFPVGRMTDPGYCWILASTYWTRARDTQTNAAYQTWDDYRVGVIRSWDSNAVGPSFGYGPEAFPPNMSGSQEDALIGAACNSQTMANILGLARGDMIGISWSHEGYPSNMQPAVAIVAERGVPNGELAWTRFDGRTVVPDSPPYDYNVSPQWAIVPNSAASTDPGPGEMRPVVSLSANPQSVTSGDSTQLSWSSSNADTCTASGDWSGDRSLSGTQVVGPLTSTSTFLLTCSNSEGSTDAEVSVNVNAAPPVGAPVVQISASPQTIASGDTSTISWTSTDATSCSASGAWSGSKPLTGNETVGPLTERSVFTLTCSNSGGSSAVSVTVSVDGGTSTSPPEEDPADDESGTGGTGPFGLMVLVLVSIWRMRRANTGRCVS